MHFLHILLFRWTLQGFSETETHVHCLRPTLIRMCEGRRRWRQQFSKRGHGARNRGWMNWAEDIVQRSALVMNDYLLSELRGGDGMIYWLVLLMDRKLIDWLIDWIYIVLLTSLTYVTLTNFRLKNTTLWNSEQLRDRSKFMGYPDRGKKTFLPTKN